MSLCAGAVPFLPVFGFSSPLCDLASRERRVSDDFIQEGHLHSPSALGAQEGAGGEGVV